MWDTGHGTLHFLEAGRLKPRTASGNIPPMCAEGMGVRGILQQIWDGKSLLILTAELLRLVHKKERALTFIRSIETDLTNSLTGVYTYWIRSIIKQTTNLT